MIDGFATNRHIAALKAEPKWTINGVLPKSNPDKPAKAPLNAKKLIASGGEKVVGAHNHTSECLVHFSQLEPFITRTIPDNTGYAYWLSGLTDGYLVLDIEKTCPADVADDLIATLPWVYAEQSMSGKGYHLLLPVPDEFFSYGEYLLKPALEGENKWYEVLLNHYVTFTGKPLDDEREPSSDSSRWNELFEKLIERAPVPKVRQVFDVAAVRPETDHHHTLVALLTDPYAVMPTTTVADFAHDTSRWEFSILNFFNSRLIVSAGEQNLRLTLDEQAWILFEAATAYLPYRDKHDTSRSGLPYLLWQAQVIVAERPQNDLTSAQRESLLEVIATLDYPSKAEADARVNSSATRRSRG